MSHRRPAKSTQTPWVLALLIVPGLVSVPTGQTAGQTGTLTEHPYIKPSEIKSETCLGCHPDKNEGKFVHPAIALGCESCHQAISAKDKKTTAVTLVAQGGRLCAVCHEVKLDSAIHGPYKAGHCLICHEPHASNFAKETRAETNMLCLSCHGLNQPDVKVDEAAKSVILPASRSISLDDYNQARKIELDRSGTKGHPRLIHPVANRPDPLRTGENMTCLSCHGAHATPLPKLIRTAENGKDICETCHQAIEKQRQMEVQQKQQADLQGRGGEKQP